MATADNVRTQYEDGLVLGASQLIADQTYMRASFERRSLTRDLFGIVWGLELVIETAPAGATQSALVRVTPGVAYGGDGKAIVLRDPSEVSSLLKGKDKGTSWAVYAVYQESSVRGQSGFSFCGQAMDPHVTESAALVIERFLSPLGEGERSGARIEPESALGGTTQPTLSRVLLGVVELDQQSQPFLHRVAGTVRIPDVTPTTSELEATKAPLDQSEFAGLVGSAIAHPRAWEESLTGTLVPAITLEPAGGVHVRQKTVLDDDAHAKGLLVVEGNLVAQSGVAFARRIFGGKAAKDVVQRVVTLRGEFVDVAQITTTDDDSMRVLGIAVAAYGDDQVLVVFSGLATAQVDSSVASSDPAGTWLRLSATDAGKLADATATPSVGTLVAKLIKKNQDNTASVLVTLG
ncbi:MAG TPA: hypothetical protein VFK05_13750 [Polyangiaceae bacterium]|nr:hypothetical protein [Polyangiaceae bacterium]